ncbi:MAG: dihydropteroate synthase [Nitrospinae bacterium]|nr:dihydropteroate synthase [Nitrospinota bacterium]
MKNENIFHCSQYQFNLQQRPIIFSIFNLTPDSFYDGGKLKGLDVLLKKVETDIVHGADIIDIGGESTRPGSKSITIEEEIERIEKPIYEIKKRFDIPVSIDTTKYDVAKVAVENGADIINDTSGFTDSPEMLELAAKMRLGIVIMHRRNIPEIMQKEVHYDDCLKEVKAFLEKQVKLAVSKGVDKSSIFLDPGIGFGKEVNHNIELLTGIKKLQKSGFPLLIGLSRKSYMGKILNNTAKERLTGTIASTALVLQQGVQALRIHDVKETFETVKIVQAFHKNLAGKRLASIDIGSNTCRLLISEIKNNKLKKVFETQKIIRLSEKIVNTSQISEAAIERLLNLLTCYGSYFKKFEVEDYIITATSAMREAENNKDIVKQVKKQTGLNITIISEKREAELAYRGVYSGLSTEYKKVKNKILVDIGGGSTEFTLIENFSGNENIIKSVSLPIGVVKLKDLHIKNDPPNNREIDKVKNQVKDFLSQLGFPEIQPKETVFIGTAGTITTLAAVYLNMKWYDGEKINNTSLSKSAIEKQLDLFCAMTNNERASLPQLEKGREDLIIPGILLLLESMNHFGFKKILIVDNSLREGSLSELASNFTV